MVFLHPSKLGGQSTVRMGMIYMVQTLKRLACVLVRKIRVDEDESERYKEEL